MDNIYLYTFSSVFLVSLISFIGVISLSFKPESLKKIIFLMVSLAAGTLLGDAFLHLIPEAIEKKGVSSSVWLSLLAGILLFFILEKIVCWRHCHIPTSRTHPHPLGIMNLVGDGLHNFIDGVVIAASFMAGINIGLATTVAIIAHEIPQEIGDFGVLLHAGFSRLKAIFLNFIIALFAVLGAALTLVFGFYVENLIPYSLPIAAGGFIYIAAADLIPELKKDVHPLRSILQLVTIIIGILIMLFLKNQG
jgi:zinc and cadmium transporter